MAPQRTKKQTSNSSTAADKISQFPAVPALLPTKTGSPARTPTRSPSKVAVRLTQAQKQALIDNLQLEISERARRLRAQCARQSQSLRTRLEIRVHRVPVALRNVTLAEIIEKHATNTRVVSKAPSQISVSTPHLVKPTIKRKPQKAAKEVAKPVPAKSNKRTSAVLADDDKENTSAEQSRKRARVANAVEGLSMSRVASGAVLSPKSSNSRTLPQSPFKAPASPFKSNIARPVSPLKPLSPSKSVPPAATVQTASSLARTADKPKARTAVPRGASRQGPAVASVRGLRAVPDERRASHDSNTSGGTTIVRKAPAARTVSTVAKTKKTGLASKIAGVGTKAKKAVETQAAKRTESKQAVGSATGGRTLRKRA